MQEIKPLCYYTIIQPLYHTDQCIKETSAFQFQTIAVTCISTSNDSGTLICYPFTRKQLQEQTFEVLKCRLKEKFYPLFDQMRHKKGNEKQSSLNFSRNQGGRHGRGLKGTRHLGVGKPLEFFNRILLLDLSLHFVHFAGDRYAFGSILSNFCTG